MSDEHKLLEDELAIKQARNILKKYIELLESMPAHHVGVHSLAAAMIDFYTNTSLHTVVDADTIEQLYLESTMIAPKEVLKVLQEVREVSRYNVPYDDTEH